MKKKILLLIVLSALFCWLNTIALAQEAPIVTVATVYGQAGDTIDVSIDISNNPGIISMCLKVSYESEYLTLSKVTNGSVLKSPYHSLKDLLPNPYTLSWGDDVAEENNTDNGTIVTLSFTVSTNAPQGIHPISVSYDNTSAGIYDVDFNLIDFDVINGGINVQNLAPLNYPDREIRLTGKPGMRFSSFVNVMQRAAADEYGFMVASAEGFGGDYSAFVFPEEIKGNTALAENETASAVLDVDGKPVKFVYATAYTKDGDVDIHKAAAMDGQEGFRFNAVMINIPESAYHSDFAVRPYLRVGNVYYYGETMVGNLFETAERYDGPQNDVIDGILAAGGNK